MENKRLNYIYSFLEKLGYEVSDEERSMMSGTHDLFGGEEEDEDEEICDDEDFEDEGETVEAELIEDEDPADEDETSDEDAERDELLAKLRAEYGGETDDE